MSACLSSHPPWTYGTKSINFRLMCSRFERKKEQPSTSLSIQKWSFLLANSSLLSQPLKLWKEFMKLRLEGWWGGFIFNMFSSVYVQGGGIYVTHIAKIFLVSFVCLRMITVAAVKLSPCLQVEIIRNIYERKIPQDIRWCGVITDSKMHDCWKVYSSFSSFSAAFFSVFIWLLSYKLMKHR